MIRRIKPPLPSIPLVFAVFVLWGCGGHGPDSGCAGALISEPVFPSSRLQDKIRSLPPGGVIEARELLVRDLPCIPYGKKAGGPRFIISDAPEYIEVPEGAALRERVEPGVVRLYVYNCNGVKDTERKISTVIENLGGQPLQYRFLRYASPPPSGNYVQTAKTALEAFYRSVPEKSFRAIPPGGAAPLDPAAEAASAKYNELVHGFYEIEINQPARLSVVQTATGVPAVEANARISKAIRLEKAGAGRGQFPYSDYDVDVAAGFTLDTAEGARQLIVADGKMDPWIAGIDGAEGRPVVNNGNYGVMYRIRIPYRTSDGKALAMLTWNPNSQAKWCGVMANVVQVNAGQYPGGLVSIPSDRLSLTVDGRYDASLIQIYPPAPKGETRWIELTYSPPGAACLPTPILFVPIEP